MCETNFAMIKRWKENLGQGFTKLWAFKQFTMNYPRINQGLFNYLTIIMKLINFIFLSCIIYLNPTNRVGLIKLQGSNEFRLFELEFDLN
jgi:large-conductance mechanosensitive channel